MKKLKAVTFSYDDGVTQDQRLIDMFNRYGLKCTFNLNSGKFDQAGRLIREDVTVAHVKPRACEVRAIYEGHEIAAHTLTHPSLTKLTDDEVVREVEEDRLALSEIAGYEVVGMAYPNGSVDDRVEALIKTSTGIRYARTVDCTYDFEPCKTLHTLSFTAYHHRDFDRLFELAEQFIDMKAETPQIFSIWGHAYEFDIANTWAKMEDFCKLISGHADMFYGTNKEVFLLDDWK